MPTVLIIESDAAVAKHLTILLGAKRIESKVTSDGTEGVNLARTAQPAVIVLCVELSRVSGYSICNKLKKDPDLGKIPLILTSSQATEETFEQHKKLKTRAEAYLKKPFGDAEIMGLINEYISGGGAAADEVSLDEVSVEIDDAAAPTGSSVDVDSVVFGGNAGLDLEEPAPPKPASRPSASDTVVMTKPALAVARAAARPATAASDGQLEHVRNESRQLRQKIQQLEQQLEQKELEFNDRLLQESSRGREAVDARKKLAGLERDMAKYKDAAEKAKLEVEQARAELEHSKHEGKSVDAEKQTMMTKIGQLVDKVKALAAERDGLQQEVERLQGELAEVREETENAVKVREKAKKAVDIALQLLGETGLVQ